MAYPDTPSRALGGAASGVTVGSVGLGLSALTASTLPNEQPVPDEQAFATLNAALENGSTFWNGATFYTSSREEMTNLSLLKRYFEKYPENASKVTLSIKGGFTPFYNFVTGADSSVDALRKELIQANKTLGPNKKIDIFQPARRDPKVSYPVSAVRCSCHVHHADFFH